MSHCGHQYVMSLQRQDGHVLAHYSVTDEFGPAIESAILDGVRCMSLPSRQVLSPETRVEPAWNRDAGAPYTSGFRVSILVDGIGSSSEFSNTYFADLAQSASGKFVTSGELKAGDKFGYVVTAFPRSPEGDVPATGPFNVRFRVPGFPVKEGSGEALFRCETVQPSGEADETSEDLPFFMPQHVLDEASELTLSAGENETGGILIGHLHRPAKNGDLTMECTAQIPARYTDADLTRLTFTADTWTAVQEAIDTRKRSEIMLGWWHSHSFMKSHCRGCAKAKENSCTSSAAFLSSADRMLHWTVFPRAYSVALVISDSPCGGLTWRMFGWRKGRLLPRGFRILGVAGGTAEEGQGRGEMSLAEQEK